MCSRLPRPRHVCGACAPPLSCPLSAEPCTTSLSLHHSHVCYRTSSPYASLRGDIFAFVQGVGPFTWVPAETGKDMRAHTDLIILLKEGIHIKMPECVRHFHTWISRLGISNLAGANHFFFLLPLQPL